MLSLYGGSEEEMDGQNFGNNQTPSHFSGNGAAEGHCIVKLVDVPQNECPNIKNHSSIYYRNRIWLFGGYDGKKNHATVHALNVATAQWERLTTTGTVPEGRNGHTASLIANKMYVIGGWLGSGTFASSEVYILNLDAHEWTLSQTHGQSPGPCNMHSADVVDERFIYIFRGGDGKDYLNDLHRLDTETLTWTLLAPAGAPPPPRANHCSTLIRRSLYVFGGWDGAKRLNDIFYFHIDTGVWHEVNLASQAPSPRAGMSMVAIDEKIYLFGGSGPSASCFNDLQIFDPQTNAWTLATIVGDGQLKSRAGHSMTVAEDNRLFIIGGSCGSSYYKDFFVLDTDPAPIVLPLRGPPLKHLLAHYCNNPTFSDVQLLVEGRVFYGHKLVLSLLGERFRAMFASGMREQFDEKIVIPNVEYDTFVRICQYLYSGSSMLFGSENSQIVGLQRQQQQGGVGDDNGEVTSDQAAEVMEIQESQQQQQQQGGVGATGREPIAAGRARARSPKNKSDSTALSSQTSKALTLEDILKLVRAADEFMLDEIKSECEYKLKQLLNAQNYAVVAHAAEICNCQQLIRYCTWYQKRKLPAEIQNAKSSALTILKDAPLAAALEELQQ